MKENDFFIEFSTKRMKEKKEMDEYGEFTANTSRQICRRPTPNEIGKEIIREMSNAIFNWGRII